MAMVGSVNRMRALVEKCLDISTDMGKPFGGRAVRMGGGAGFAVAAGIWGDPGRLLRDDRCGVVP